MNKPAAIEGQLVSIRPIVGFCVLTIQVPEEEGQRVLDCFGYASKTSPIRVGIARLSTNADAIVSLSKDDCNTSGEASAHGAHELAEQSASNQSRPPRPVTLAMRAGMLAKEGAFTAFLASQGWNGDPAQAIRNICGVTSRRELDANPQAGFKFNNLHSSYEAWRQTA